ncbi:Unknown protein, partial [Striga hermonthica]
EKITALESFRRISPLDADELLGELKTFEINNNYDKVKSKGLALKANVVEKKEDIDDDDEGSTVDDSELKEALALITRYYGKMSRRLYKNNFTGKKVNNHSKNVVQDKKNSAPFSKPDSQRIEKHQCWECRGFCHFQYECANLKKKNKSQKATWEDSDDEGSDEPPSHTRIMVIHSSVKKFMCLTTSHVRQTSEAMKKLQSEVHKLTRENKMLIEQSTPSFTVEKDNELDTAKARTSILEGSVKLAKQDGLEKTQTIECLRSELFSTQKLLTKQNKEILKLKSEVSRLMTNI